MDVVIDIKNFKKAYGTKIVHRGINLSVKKGECLGLIGSSGIGKSVILRSLIGLEKPDEGDIKVLDHSINNYSEKQLIAVRKRVAYVFQDGALFDSMSVYDNLAFPLREHTKLTERQIFDKITLTLESFGLSGNENSFPKSLSGGMQKRLGIARAIILGPEIILYDEPTAGLDPYNTKKIQEMILRLKQTGVTSILVTHDMVTAMAVCDRISMIIHGVIKSEGSVDEIKNQKDHLIAKFIEGGAH